MQRRIPLPRRWNRRVKSTILQILALSHYAFTAVLARGANAWDPRRRLQAELDRLDQDVALLREEIAIKDVRISPVHRHRRPFYAPLERWTTSSVSTLRKVGEPAHLLR